MKKKKIKLIQLIKGHIENNIKEYIIILLIFII